MIKKYRQHSLVFLFVIALPLLVSSSTFSQKRDAFRIDYTVKVASLDSQLFHVTANVKNINEPQLDLSLPTWTPGWYTGMNLNVGYGLGLFAGSGTSALSASLRLRVQSSRY